MLLCRKVFQFVGRQRCGGLAVVLRSRGFIAHDGTEATVPGPARRPEGRCTVATDVIMPSAASLSTGSLTTLANVTCGNGVLPHRLSSGGSGGMRLARSLSLSR